MFLSKPDPCAKTQCSPWSLFLHGTGQTSRYLTMRGHCRTFLRSSLGSLNQLSEGQADGPCFHLKGRHLLTISEPLTPVISQFLQGITVTNLSFTWNHMRPLYRARMVLAGSMQLTYLCMEFSIPGKGDLRQISIPTRHQAGTPPGNSFMKGVCLIFPCYKEKNTTLEKRYLSALLPCSSNTWGLSDREYLVQDLSDCLEGLLPFTQCLTV